MAEQVNQRIEEMINELEQMRRTNLYTDEEIKEISRKRKEFEYKVQRRVKEKEDYVQYIAYELALLEDISLRRKQNKLVEKKKDLEYAIAKRLNKLFKQFIYRFQNEVEIYFEYIKFCKSVGFDAQASAIIGQMLQMHGDKPKMWQMAAKWEWKEQNNLESARSFLIKGIHRHPESEILYLDLFEIELILAAKATDEEEKEKQIKRADVIWKNGVGTVSDACMYLFNICDISMRYEVKNMTKEIKAKIWENRDKKEVWSYIASMELKGQHWEEIEEFVDDENNYSKEVNNYIAVYEEALEQFPDKNLCTKYIHGLLGADEAVCSDEQRISAVKHAWRFGHDNGLLTDDMYAFGIELLKLENETSEEEFMEILDTATKHNPQARNIWAEKLELNKKDIKKVMSILQEATKVLKPDDALYLWNLALEDVESKDTVQNFYKRFKNCENATLMAIKPKLLKKMYEHVGLKAAREMYEEMIRTPPTQIEVHRIMIEIEVSQEKPSAKNIRKYYEGAIQQHGKNDVDIWLEYMKFETTNGIVQAAPAIYRRAISNLKRELVDEFIKKQTLAKLQTTSTNLVSETATLDLNN
ncbi:u3 small nucleolar RNA-associated protein 6 domain-containing protein [Phthorimaea operculella]|nr:u3 small nucleolar RNA-associated protein 6 domain-containing protein [Phthorimaea operculella]